MSDDKLAIGVVGTPDIVTYGFTLTLAINVELHLSFCGSSERLLPEKVRGTRSFVGPGTPVRELYYDRYRCSGKGLNCHLCTSIRGHRVVGRFARAYGNSARVITDVSVDKRKWAQR